MIRRLLGITVLLMGMVTGGYAQDNFSLPAELYVLTNLGVIERYGLDAAGKEAITPEDIYVLDFGVDASGERLAYRTESGISLLTLNLEDALPIDVGDEAASIPPYRGFGDTIAWSPTGDVLAYTTEFGIRVYFETGAGAEFIDLNDSLILSLDWSQDGTYLAAEGENNVWWIYHRQGMTLSLTSVISSSIGTAWISDNEIVFAPETGGLNLMNLAQANAQTTLLDESVEYRLPYLNHRDELVFFARPKNDPAILDGFGTLMRLSRGAQQVETVGQASISLNGLRWAQGGVLMMAFQGGVLALYDPVAGDFAPFSVNNAVAYAWGPLALETPPLIVIIPTPAPEVTFDVEVTIAIDVTEPIGQMTPTAEPVTGINLSANLFFFASDINNNTQVWRLPSNGSSAFQYTNAPLAISEFTVDASGNNLIYVSDGVLWLQQSTSRLPTIVAELDSFAPATPHISRDGLRVVYSDEAIQGGGIYIATLGQAPQIVLSNITHSESEYRVYRRPQFSHDGQRLLVDIYTTNGVITGIYNIQTETLTEISPESADDLRALTSRWLSNGDILTFMDSRLESSVPIGFYTFNSLEVTTPPTRIPIPPNTYVLDTVEITPGRMRLIVAEPNAPDAPLMVVDETAIQQTDVITIPPLIAPRLSPDALFVAGYPSFSSIDGINQGPLVIVDLRTGGQFILTLPETLWGFQWTQ